MKALLIVAGLLLLIPVLAAVILIGCFMIQVDVCGSDSNRDL